MSLFSKTEISKEILPFIENGEGVGVVKVNGYGKASARMESYKIIFDSYEGKSPIIESVSAITYLSYKKGNFLNEPKLEIGISHKKYILAGVDNNDAELETFYKTILDIKNLEKEQKRSSYVGINKSAAEDGSKNVEDVSAKVTEEDNVDLEDEILKEEASEETVETKSKEEVQESAEDLEKIIEEDEDDFEVLEELDEDVEVSEEPQKEETVAVEESEVSEEVEEIESTEEIMLEDVDEDEDEFEEIYIGSDEPPAEDFEGDNLLSDEPIIEDFDEDFEDFDEEVTDKEVDSDRIVKADETAQKDVIEDEIQVEDDIFEEDSEEVETVEEESSEVVEPVEEEASKEVKENIIQDNLQQSAPQIDDNEITTENVTSEIGKMKQRLYGGISNIQSELSKENNTSQVQMDPVDQIRRYHELKEDGIITEEEFELKKKQLLDL